MNNYSFKILSLAVVIFNCSILNASAFCIYNASKNKCLRTSGPGSPLTYGICDDAADWQASNYFNSPAPYTSVAYPGYCISTENGNVTIKECDNDTTLHLKGNQLFQSNSIDICLGSSENNPNEVTLKQCNENDQDQIWFFNSLETVGVYIYNAAKNKCLRTSGEPESPVTFGACDNSDNIVWNIPFTHEGYYRSKVNPNYCLSIDNNVVSLKECNENTIVSRNGNFIKSPLSENYCVGSSEKDPKGISVKECDANDQNQIWYFNNWDPSVVMEEFPEVPETVTVFFYNAFKNECLSTDGSSVVFGSCDFTKEDALWDIPTSHDGYYRSKANPEKCLSIMNGGVITLSDCNENTTLYRDGNFIKSPLSNDYCIGSSESDPKGVSLKGCNENDQDQIWYFNNWDPSVVIEEFPSLPETVSVYFYNVFKNGCINSDGATVTVGNCDFTNQYSLWEIPTSHDGYYRSKVNPEKCLSIMDGGVVTLSDCNENTTLYRDGNLIKSPLSNNYCIVPSKSDDSLEYSETCNDNDFNNLWYFNVYTDSVVPTEDVDTSIEFEVPTEDVDASIEFDVPTEDVDASIEFDVPIEDVDASIEVVPPAEVVAAFTDVVAPTEAVAAFTDVVAPTEVVEENPTMTITTTFTAVMTEAY